jgi:hypothetical protein
MEGKITVNYIEVSSYSLTEDGYFKCDHEFAEVTPPCCSGRDCGCYGLYSVYCPDCDYMNMPDFEVDALIEATIPEEPEYEPELEYAV